MPLLNLEDIELDTGLGMIGFVYFTAEAFS